MTDLEIKLGESDGFRRQQVQELCDALATAHGNNAVLRARIAELETKLINCTAPTQ